MAVLATNQQLNDMVHFLTDPTQHTVMGIDPTFNFGNFNVIPIAFHYLLYTGAQKRRTFTNFLLVHQQKNFASYHFLASTLISLCPSLRNIRAFGSDGETQLYQAFQMQFLEAIHLQCFQHFRTNLVTRLEKLHETWNQHDPHHSPVFYNWFVKEKSRDVKSSMLLSLREAAGLGSPPSPFYTNANGCLNSMLHEKVKYKKSQWHKFNESMRAG